MFPKEKLRKKITRIALRHILCRDAGVNYAELSQNTCSSQKSRSEDTATSIQNHQSHTNIIMELRDANLHKIICMSPDNCK
jgi:hypothetical protein